MAGNLSRRVNRLENKGAVTRVAVVQMRENETQEEAWERHLRDYPKDRDATLKVFIDRWFCK